MIKVSVLYPNSPGATFDMAYYTSKHMPLVDKVPGVKKIEIATVFPPAPNQPAPPYYRITEVYFENVETMLKTFASPEWDAVLKDVPNFANPSTVSGFASQIGA